MTMTAAAVTVPDGRFRRLVKRYLQAHEAFTLGAFDQAAAIYWELSQALAPQWAAIVRKNRPLATAPLFDADGDLTAEQAAAALGYTGKKADDWLSRTAWRLTPQSSEGRVASLCAAVAHDLALIGRHKAEASGQGRDPRIAEAVIRSFAHAIAVNPSSNSAYHNLAGYEDFLGLFPQAVERYRAAVNLNPMQGESWVSLGHALMRVGRAIEGEEAWDRGLRIASSNGQPNWYAAMLRLLKGDYKKGWEDYEGRLTFPPYIHRYGRPELSAPRWCGERIAGHLFLHGEQGAGDVIQFLRYVPVVRELVGALTVEVPIGLVRLIRVLLRDVDCTVIAKGDPVPAHAEQLSMFSLPHVMGTTLETVPPAPWF